MIRGYIILIAISLLAFRANGQEPNNSPMLDSEAIKLAILNIDSPYYYSKLFERYAEGDTTLNLEEYRLLYYGYAYNDNYRPLETNNYRDSVMMVLHQVKGDTIASRLFDEIVYYGSKMLEDRPFDLNFINLMTYCYQKMGMTREALRYSHKLTMIIETILSSGTGRDKSLPWHILYREDAGDVIAMMGSSYYKRIYITTTVEYLLLTEKIDKNKGFYFDISRLYMKIPEREENRKRKMEFNPLYNPKSEKFLSPEQKYLSE